MIDPDDLSEDDAEFEPPLSDLDGSRIVPKIDLPVVNEEAAADQVIRILAKHGNIFQRNGSLVKITRKKRIPRLIRELSDLPTIGTCSIHTVREMISAHFRFIKKGKHGEDVSASCPEWLKNAVHDRGEWEHVRPLTGVVTWPAMRTDGTFISKPGYDEDTGLYYVGPEVSVPECPTLKQAEEAANYILEVVSEFPFQNDSHRSAWFALPLTLMVRYAIDLAPLWVFDAPVPGTGKTLLAELAVRMVTGGNVAKMSPSQDGDSDEDRKRITSLAMVGEVATLVDNVVGAFGNATFDAALTAEEWSDRVLGSNRIIRMPLRIVWMVSGNNVMIRGDMQRRVLHCRVDPQLERPEERVFKRLQGELSDMVSRNRPEYLRALMTVLRASMASDLPRMKSWGSFELWGAFVRAATIHSGLTDPAETRDTFRRAADMSHEARIQLLSALHRSCIANDPGEFNTKGLYGIMGDDAREAASELARCQAKDFSAQKFAYVLRSLKGRVAGGKIIRSKENGDGQQVWWVESV